MATHRTGNNNNLPKELPDHIILQIFKCLPVKSICRFRCCSKFINEFTQETHFLKQQFENSLLKDDPCFFIQYKGEFCYEFCVLPGEDTSSCGIHPEFLKLLQKHVKILASSNGLILCLFPREEPCPLGGVHYQEMPLIVNPALSLYYKIPTPVSSDMIQRGQVSVDYAFERNSEGYKLFAFVEDFLKDPLSLFCSIYVEKERVWKEREAKFFVGNRTMDFHSPVFYKGIIHVLSKCDVVINCPNPYIIATYNYERGISSFLSLPKESTRIFGDYQSKFHDLQVGIFKWGKVTSLNESICVVRIDETGVFGIWVLSDYKSKCWTKFMKVSLQEMGLGMKNSCVVGFTIMNGGDSLVFATKRRVFSYDLIGQWKIRLEKVRAHEGYFISFVPYSSSFGPFYSSYYDKKKLIGALIDS